MGSENSQIKAGIPVAKKNAQAELKKQPSASLDGASDIDETPPQSDTITSPTVSSSPQQEELQELKTKNLVSNPESINPTLTITTSSAGYAPKPVNLEKSTSSQKSESFAVVVATPNKEELAAELLKAVRGFRAQLNNIGSVGGSAVTQDRDYIFLGTRLDNYAAKSREDINQIQDALQQINTVLPTEIEKLHKKYEEQSAVTLTELNIESPTSATVTFAPSSSLNTSTLLSEKARVNNFAFRANTMLEGLSTSHEADNENKIISSPASTIFDKKEESNTLGDSQSEEELEVKLESEPSSEKSDDDPSLTLPPISSRPIFHHYPELMPSKVSGPDPDIDIEIEPTKEIPDTESVTMPFLESQRISSAGGSNVYTGSEHDLKPPAPVSTPPLTPVPSPTLTPSSQSQWKELYKGYVIEQEARLMGFIDEARVNQRDLNSIPKYSELNAELQKLKTFSVSTKEGFEFLRNRIDSLMSDMAVIVEQQAHKDKERTLGTLMGRLHRLPEEVNQEPTFRLEDLNTKLDIINHQAEELLGRQEQYQIAKFGLQQKYDILIDHRFDPRKCDAEFRADLEKLNDKYDDVAYAPNPPVFGAEPLLPENPTPIPSGSSSFSPLPQGTPPALGGSNASPLPPAPPGFGSTPTSPMPPLELSGGTAGASPQAPSFAVAKVPVALRDLRGGLVDRERIDSIEQHYRHQMQQIAASSPEKQEKRDRAIRGYSNIIHGLLVGSFGKGQSDWNKTLEQVAAREDKFRKEALNIAPTPAPAPRGSSPTNSTAPTPKDNPAANSTSSGRRSSTYGNFLGAMQGAQNRPKEGKKRKEGLQKEFDQLREALINSIDTLEKDSRVSVAEVEKARRHRDQSLASMDKQKEKGTHLTWLAKTTGHLAEHDDLPPARTPKKR
ncbi:MAG TPA: hypothetical protein VHE99_09605 [Gammaproteobacteria bacterium]|nr:hypothetical protein [Gammaproteobacteria bacterium]